MAVNKVIYAGSTLLDLTGDTVEADKLLAGYTAHDKSGNQITGTAGIAASDDGAGNVTITLSGVGGITVG